MCSDSEEHLTPRRQDAKVPRKTRIKICGLRDVGNARAAAEAGADFVGLNFVEKSPRYVEPETARAIVEALPAGVEPVGLFCDHPAEQVRATAAAAGLKTVQLHGEETPEFAEQLGALRVLKVFAFRRDRLADQLADWKGRTDRVTALLIDTPPEPDAKITGGSGRAFDWSALAQSQTEGDFAGLPPVMLAGGLTPGNVGEAIRAARPWGVDVSSGVESSRGVKDPGMIADFCAAVREADAELR